MSVRRGLTDNLSVRRGLTDNLPVRRGLTDNLSVRRGLTDNLSIRRGLTDNLSVRMGLTDTFSANDNFPCKGSREGLLDKQITSIAVNLVVMKNRAAKHCSWRLCKSDSCYPESIPEGTHYIRFANVGKVKDGMTEWEKNKQNELTEKAKKLVHSCSRKGFTINKISKDTYICSLPFVAGNGLTEEDPEPINASLLECELVRKKDKKKRKIPLEWDPLLAKKKKVRTKKHSEMEIYPLNSTLQNDATDFDEPLVGDCQHCLPSHPIINRNVGISFDISYGNLP